MTPEGLDGIHGRPAQAPGRNVSRETLARSLTSMKGEPESGCSPCASAPPSWRRTVRASRHAAKPTRTERQPADPTSMGQGWPALSQGNRRRLFPLPTGRGKWLAEMFHVKHSGEDCPHCMVATGSGGPQPIGQEQPESLRRRCMVGRHERCAWTGTCLPEPVVGRAEGQAGIPAVHGRTEPFPRPDGENSHLQCFT